MEKSSRKCALKLAPDPFLILINNSKQSFNTRNSFRNKAFWESITEKPLKS